MARRMDEIFDYSAEIEKSLSYTNIRIRKVGFQASDTEQENISKAGGKWFDASDKKRLTAFSAVCFLYARELADMLGGNKVNVNTFVCSLILTWDVSQK